MSQQNYYGLPQQTNPYTNYGAALPGVPANQVGAALSAIGQPQPGANGSTMSVSPVSGASLKGIGSTGSAPAQQSIAAALPLAASALGSGGGASGAAGAASAKGGIGGAMGVAGQGMGILGGLANIYFGWQAQKLAKKNLKFNIGAYNNNLVNTVQSYNTSLEDRVRARHNTEGRSGSETSSYLNNNRLQANTLSY